MNVRYGMPVIAVLLFLGFMQATAQEDCLNYEDYMHWQGVARISFDEESDRCRGVAVAGEFAYIACDDEFGLRVVYLAAPPPYPTVAYVDALEDARDVAISGDYAFVAAIAGFAVLDISDPYAPVVVDELSIPATLPESTTLSTITIAGDKACIGGRYNSGGVFLVVDVSNPCEIELGGAVLLPDEVWSIVMANDNIACVAADGAGVLLVDITTPIVVGEITMQGTTRSLATDGDHVYIAAGLLWVFTLNGQLQCAVQLLGGQNAEKIVLAEDYVYVTAGEMLHKVDVSNPGSPLDTGYICSGGPWSGGDIVLQDDYIYYAREQEFHVVYCSGSCAPAVAGTVDLLGARFIETDGSYVYAVADDGDMFVIDSSPGPSPEIVGQWSPANGSFEPRDLAVSEDFACVLWGGGIYVVDINEPNAPTTITHIDLDLPNTIHQMAVAHRHIYVAWGGYTGHDLIVEGGIRIIDISDIYSPQVVFDPYWNIECHHVAVHDNYMYVDWCCAWPPAGGVIFDVTNPSVPLEVGVMQRFEDLVFVGQIAYSAWGGWEIYADGITVWDNTNPRAPTIIGSYPSETTDITIVGSCLYALSNVVRIFDVNDPQYPTIVGAATLSGQPRDAAFSGGLFYVGAEDAGVQVVLPQCQATTPVSDGPVYGDLEIASPPASTRLIDAYPNPFNPRTTIAFTLARPQYAEVTVYDLVGQRIAVLMARSLDAGTHSVIWQGTDAAGRSVPSGGYIVRLSTESGVQTRKVVLLR